MKRKLMLISGCSHAAGAEIDGTMDSSYNRARSFGNLLAVHLGRTPINIASAGSTNATISRTIQEWVDKFYNEQEHDLVVLIAWTESSRMEIPVPHYKADGVERDLYADYRSEFSKYFFRVNPGWAGFDDYEKRIVRVCHEFMANNDVFLEILSANIVLQTHYYLKSKNIKHLMCNTMFMFSGDYHFDYYDKLLPAHLYYKMRVNSLAFYEKYQNMDFKNPRAQYWHHGDVPHSLYALELLEFYRELYEN